MKYEAFHTATDGTRIWYGHSNLGSLPLVLCDGIGCDGFIWPYLIDRFRDDHTIVRWHYRGHGRSEVPRDLSHLSIEDLVEDLFGILDELGLERVVLAGHSMGVQVILEAMRHHSHRVAGLVPICGSYGRPADTFHGTHLYRPVFERAIRTVRRLPRLSTAIWRRILPTGLSLQVARFTELNRELVRPVDFMPYLEHLSTMRADVFFRMLEFAIDHTTEDLLETIDVPTLIIAGEHDKFTPAACSEEMHRRIPNAGLVVIEGGTHTAPIERPDDMEAALEPFLKDLLARENAAASDTAPSPRQAETAGA